MTTAEPSDLFPISRLGDAARAAASAGIDALLLTPGADLRYLTGYPAIALERLTCLVVPADGDPALVVPRLERPAALASPVGASGVAVHAWDETDDPFALVASLVTAALGRPASRVGVADGMWAEHVLALRAALPIAEQVLAGSVLRGLRARKTDAEVSALRRAGAAIDRVHARMGEWLRAGRTERQVGEDIAAAIVAEGHDSVNFVIVAGGANGASPHHHTGDYVLAPGDPVVVDIGGTTAEGYCSDNTRTYVLGEPPADFLAYYGVLAAAQAAAVAAVAPGIPAERVDAAARSIIAEAGYGDYFVHRTGHGIGLQEHEEPWIVAGNGTTLEPGMCFSVEPGIYMPGRHGARIEDIVTVTAHGVERLNVIPTELVVLGA